MSFMDLAMERHHVPSVEDVAITLPPRREPSAAESAAQQRDGGQHGGAAEGSPAGSDTHSDSPAGANSEPQPQRDEPDEGEHTDSTSEQVARRQEQKASLPEEEPEAAAADDDAIDADEEFVEEPEPVRSTPLQLHEVTGSSPLEFKKLPGGAFYGKDAKLTTVKRIPAATVDRLRMLLADVTGGDFAAQISAPALMTAFIAAKAGMDFELDENTQAAMEAFRSTDQRVSAVEEKVDQVLQHIDQLAHATHQSLKRAAETGKTVDVLDFSMSYLIADRVAHLTTPDIDETNVNVTQKKVLSTRSRIREQSASQRKIEQERNERSRA
ncbi:MULTISPECIES: hypothetical protein [unclassified Microbacterium]|uniref:hypothetical protein n=1 Tax=unclassified Microbacterium TaxID=2609290 RepID=UPI00288323B4|nr:MULTISPECIES: hypothetical protein [unclassified Microbacterium]